MDTLNLNIKVTDTVQDILDTVVYDHLNSMLDDGLGALNDFLAIENPKRITLDDTLDTLVFCKALVVVMKALTDGTDKELELLEDLFLLHTISVMDKKAAL